jgi:hypothetical protein
MSDRPPDRPEGRPRRLPPARDSQIGNSASPPEYPNRAIKTTKIFSQLSATAGRPKRTRPLYRQLSDASWQLKAPVTEPFIIAELVAASREQGRREPETWLERRP